MESRFCPLVFLFLALGSVLAAGARADKIMLKDGSVLHSSFASHIWS